MIQAAPLFDVAAPRFPVEQWRLPNGLRVVVQPDPGAPLVGSVVCYPGSRRDPAARAGLAHLCEHLAFDGPRAGGGGFPARIENVGGAAAANTTADRLCFTALAPRRELATLLAVEAERMARPLDSNDAEALEIQRRVVLAELRERSHSRIRAVAFEHIHRLLYAPEHPYHRPASGEPDEVRAVSREDVEACVPARFSPREAVLALVGDVSVRTAAAAVSEAFESLPPGAASVPESVPTAAAPAGERTARKPAAVPETQAYVAWPIAGVGRDDYYLAALLMRALAVGRSSPLARELVERAGVAQDVSGHLVPMREASTLVFAATAARGVDADRLERGLAETVDGLLGGGLSPAGLERARKKALRDFYFATQSFERRADLCAAYTCYFDAPERLEQEPRRYLAPAIDAVAALGSRLRSDPARVRLSLVPAVEAA